MNSAFVGFISLVIKRFVTKVYKKKTKINNQNGNNFSYNKITVNVCQTQAPKNAHHLNLILNNFIHFLLSQ